MTIEPRFNDLVVGTYGRGIWILDDLTPLRTWDNVSAAGKTHLFEPRPAYRFRTSVAVPQEAPNSLVLGEDIPYGADINFYLKSPAKVTLTISGADGKTIRTLSQEGYPGLNRMWWDLRYQDPRKVVLLTPPPGEPWVTTPPAGRPLIAWGTPPAGPLVSPGTYTVKLSVDGSSAGSRQLDVLADPHTLSNQQSMKAEETFLLGMRGEINEDVDMINHIEGMRKQLDVLTQVLARDPKAAPVLGAAKNLEHKAETLEGQLFDIHLTGFREDSFRHGAQLYQCLSALAGELDRSGADLGPTDQQIQVNQMLQERLTKAAAAVQDLGSKDVAAFNSSLKSNGFTAAIQQ